MGRLSTLLVTVALVQQSVSPGSSGRFLDTLVLKDIDFKQGRNFELVSSFRYEDPKGVVWVVPQGFVSDGASIPQPLWTFVGGPWDGPYRRPAVIHDYFFRTRRYASAEVHLVFYNAMLTAGVAVPKAKLMYWGVLRFNDEWGPSTSPLPSCGSKLPKSARCIELPDQDVPTSSDVRIRVEWDANTLRAAEERINRDDPPVDELERDALAKRNAATARGK